MAVQAAAVTTVVVVVYATLLRPEGPSTISGIEAPDGGAIPRIEAHERPGKPRHPAKQGRDRRASGRAAAAAFVAGGVVAATGLVPAGGASVAPQTPAGDQYTDAAEALLDRVSGVRVPGQ